MTDQKVLEVAHVDTNSQWTEEVSDHAAAAVERQIISLAREGELEDIGIACDTADHAGAHDSVRVPLTESGPEQKVARHRTHIEVIERQARRRGGRRTDIDAEAVIRFNANRLRKVPKVARVCGACLRGDAAP